LVEEEVEGAGEGDFTFDEAIGVVGVAVFSVGVVVTAAGDGAAAALEVAVTLAAGVALGVAVDAATAGATPVQLSQTR
jgi:hypothetical protein